MREKYLAMSVIALKEMAKLRGHKGLSAMKKGDLIDLLCAEDEQRRGQEAPAAQASAGGAEGGSVSAESGKRAAAAREEGSPAGEPAKGAAAPREDGAPAEARKEGVPVRRGPIMRQRPQQPGQERGRAPMRQAGPARSGEGMRPAAQRPEGAPVRGGEGMRPTAQRPEGAPVRSGEGMRPAPRPEGRAEHLPSELTELDSGQQAAGILEVMADGYGFIRCDNYLSGENDVYVSPSQIRKFGLKTGDHITGNMRVRGQGEKFGALLYVKSINGMLPSEAQKRYVFEDMTPVFPNERLRMERGGNDVAMRIVDLISPIGKGQRGMIVSPPKAGKTTLLKDIARSILRNNPEMTVIIMLIDERPEEVTDIKEAITGPNVEVLYSTFDELPDHHKRVSEMGIERAKRLVEHNRDVTILLDSITRLARAYNLTVPPSGRTLSGGLDPAALYMPKRFFGAARNMREGGSLTVLATALVDTGSKMDDVVYEEFKGTGNMELVLDRKLSERRVFPAIDIQKSGTRREDLLLDKDELEAVYIMRKALNGLKGEEAVENILNMFVRTKDNRELVSRIRRQRFV